MFCLSVHRRCMHNTRCSLILCIIGPSIERSLNQSKCVLRSQPGKVKQKIVALLVFLFLNSAGRMLSSLRRRWYVINESNAGDKCFETAWILNVHLHLVSFAARSIITSHKYLPPWSQELIKHCSRYTNIMLKPKTYSPSNYLHLIAFIWDCEC